MCMIETGLRDERSMQWMNTIRGSLYRHSVFEHSYKLFVMPYLQFASIVLFRGSKNLG